MAAPTRNAVLALTGDTGTTAYTPSIATLRTGCLARDVIRVWLATDGNPTVGLSAQSVTDGWSVVTQIADATVACKAALLQFRVVTDGVAPDPAITLSASEAVTGYGDRVRPSSGKAVALLTPTTAQGSSTNPDPAAITNSSGATQDFLFTVFGGGDGITAFTVSPASYSAIAASTISNAANGSSYGYADRTVNAVASAGSENPAVFTRVTEQWATITAAAYEIDPPAVCVPAEASHGHTADQPVVTHTPPPPAICTPAETVHAHTADVPTAVFRSICTPAEATHAHAADEAAVVHYAPTGPAAVTGAAGAISGGGISSGSISGGFGGRTPQNWVVSLDDSVIASDLVSLTGGNALTFSDGVNAADAFSRTVSYIRTKADTATAVDAFTKALARLRTLADSVSAVDAFTRQITLARTFNDLVGAADAITSIDQHFRRTLDDTVSAVDATGVTRLIKLDDAVTATDQISLHPIRNLSDSVEAVDAITLTLDRTSLRLEAWPTICYVADVSTSACYRLTADPSSQLFIESVEEYSPEARSPAHAE